MAPRLPVVLPQSGPLRLPQQVVDQVVDAVRAAVALPATALTRVEALLRGAERLLDDVNALLVRIEGTRARAGVVVERVDRISAGAGPLLDRVGTLLDDLEPSLTKLQPTLERLADTTSPEEVEALVALIDRLPMLSEKLESDIFPILDSLDSVAPDLHDLLDASKELNEMLARMPGMKRMRKRIDEAQAREGRG